MLLPHPQTNDNKYSRGMVTVIGGCSAYPGAAMLAGCAAYAASRSGAGYVSVFTSSDNVKLVQACKPSLVVRSWNNIDSLENALIPSSKERPRSYVIGPGFDTQDDIVRNLLEMALGVDAPLVIDGGALSMLKDSTLCERLVHRSIVGQGTVLTPHAGEASKIASGFSLDAVTPEQLSETIAHVSGAICMLKGPVTYISDGCRTVTMDEGTPALAKAGTGDVLAGIVGALLLKMEDPFEAALRASQLHAFTAHQCIRETGDIALTPEDMIEKLATSVKDFEADCKMKDSGESRYDG